MSGFQFNGMILPARVRRAVLTGAMGAGVIGVLMAGFSVVQALTADNLGTGFIETVKEDFVPSNLEFTVDVANIQILAATTNADPLGEAAPGVEATDLLPVVRNAHLAGFPTYQFDVKEVAVNSWQTGDDFKIEVFGYDGVTNSLLATVYSKQATVNDSLIEGVRVKVAQPLIEKSNDLFTDTNGTLIDNHTPSPTGTGWSASQPSCNGQSCFTIESNTALLHQKKGVTRVVRETTDLGNDDMDVAADLILTGTDGIGATQFAGIVARISSSDFNNYYLVALEDFLPGDVHFYKVVGGAKTELGSFWDANSDSVTVKLEIRAGSQKVYGCSPAPCTPTVVRISATEPDTTLQGNNFAGIAAADDDNLDPTIDNYLVKALGNLSDLIWSIDITPQ